MQGRITIIGNLCKAKMGKSSTPFFIGMKFLKILRLARNRRNLRII